MQKKIKVVATLLIIICGCSHQNMSAESWIDYNGLSEINAGLSQKELKRVLGEPLLVLGNNDSNENTIYLFYNYHVKRYLSKDNQRDSFNERRTLIKFTFENDELKSWDEDNITLNMAHNKKPRTSLIKYVNLLINIILLGAVFGGS